MSLLLYNILLRIYHLTIIIVSPFNKKASLWLNGRKSYFRKLQSMMYKNTSPVIWFHCASLGEFEQSRPLIEVIYKQFPQYNILLTFFSPSGFEVRKNYELATYVLYLPLDTNFNARKFIRVVKPKLALFAKYEFWHHYISELNTKKIPVISFSAIFRKEQIFFKSYGGFYSHILSNFTKIFVQNKESIQLLEKINIKSELAGDTRFDRVKTICENKNNFPVVEKFKNSKKLFIIGSSWEKDIKVLENLINDPAKDFKVIIAPHEITGDKILLLEKKLKKRHIRYSQLQEENASNYDLLIIDNVGILNSLYQYGEFAYIGGAFGKGLHNILEAATFGLPVFFGPTYNKFQEAEDLIKLECAFSIKNSSELQAKFDSIYTDEEKRKSISEKSKKYISEHTGATEKILNYCKQFLDKQ